MNKTRQNSYIAVRNFIYAGIAFIAMGLAACTQDDDTATSLKGQEINATFSVGGVQTHCEPSSWLYLRSSAR